MGTYGVYGESKDHGVHGSVTGVGGTGVYGISTTVVQEGGHEYPNWGGYFEASGRESTGVHAEAEQVGGRFESWDRAVLSYKNTGNLKAVLQHVDISREHQELILEQANAE